MAALQVLVACFFCIFCCCFSSGWANKEATWQIALLIFIFKPELSFRVLLPPPSPPFAVGRHLASGNPWRMCAHTLPSPPHIPCPAVLIQSHCCVFPTFSNVVDNGQVTPKKIKIIKIKKTCRCQWKNLLQNAFSFETFAQTFLPGKVHLKKQCKHKQLQHMLPYIWTHISQALSTPLSLPPPHSLPPSL